jgi:hypothetical protein
VRCLFAAIPEESEQCKGSTTVKQEEGFNPLHRILVAFSPVPLLVVRKLHNSFLLRIIEGRYLLTLQDNTTKLLDHPLAQRIPGSSEQSEGVIGGQKAHRGIFVHDAPATHAASTSR